VLIMDVSSGQIGKVLDLIYDAAAEPDLWSHVLTAIADLTHCEGGILFGQSITAKQVYFDFNGRLDEDCNRSYRERHMQNRWSLYMQSQPVGRLVLSDEAMPLAQLQATDFYDEVLRPQGVAHSGMIALAARDDFRSAFNICRSPQRGPLDDDEQRLLRWLSSHLCRSVTLGFRVDSYLAVQRAAFDVLERLADGVILLDRKARVLFANAIAREIIDSGALGFSPSIETHSPAHSHRFTALVRAALLGGAGGSMSLPNLAGDELLTVMVAAIRGKDIGRLFEAGIDDAAVMVFVINPGKRQSIPIEQLMQAYGLTRAEARIALVAASGSTVPATATAFGLSSNTVKTHMRRVFAKTETGGQAELAALIAALGSIRGWARADAPDETGLPRANE
jgi:DNA-binding CsgD family transcriptional regulator